MTTRQTLIDISTLYSFVGQNNTRTYNIHLARCLGNDKSAAILLAQIMYWTGNIAPVGRDWFFKTDKEWMVELCFNENELRTAKNKLKNLGLIETRLKRAKGSPTLHYRIIPDALSTLISGFRENRYNESVEIGTSITKTTTQTTEETIINTCRKKPAASNCVSDPPKSKRTTNPPTTKQRSYLLFKKIITNPSTPEEEVAAQFFEEFEFRRREKHPMLSDDQVTAGLKLIKEHVIDNFLHEWCGESELDCVSDIIYQHFRKKIFHEQGRDFRFPLFVANLHMYVAERYK